MVSGNGRMGAIVYGKPESPVVILNHDRLYTSEYDHATVGPANTARFLPEIRRLIKEKGYKEALNFSYQKSKENGMAPDENIDFHPGFFLNFKLPGAEQAADYRRSENFQTGEVETRWTGAAGKFRTKLFVSRADNVVVMSITGPGAGRLNCDMEIGPVGSKFIQSQPESGADWIGVHDLYAPGNGGYDGIVRIVPHGGTLRIENGHAVVSKADNVVVVMR
ncbi:MAG TPA: glycoside hydrolase N-terminal domain-containing protein, partial [Candidatus Methylacidiphilales bacterium]